MAAGLAWFGSALPGTAQTGGAQTAAEQALANSRVLPLIDPCASGGSGDDIVVCGRRDGQERYRLPQTGESEPFAVGRRVPGEAPRASAEPLSFAPAGYSLTSGAARSGRCSRPAMAAGATR